jgi:hypothetical protein
MDCEVYWMLQNFARFVFLNPTFQSHHLTIPFPVNDLDSKDMPWDISSLVDLSLQEMSPRIMVLLR